MASDALCGGGLQTIARSILYIKSGSTQERKFVPQDAHVVNVDRHGKGGIMKEYFVCSCNYMKMEMRI